MQQVRHGSTMTLAQEVRRGSTMAARRSSVVVSQELGAILGKPNALAADAGDPSDDEAAMLAAGLSAAGRSQAFFPELSQLTKVGFARAIIYSSCKLYLPCPVVTCQPSSPD